MSRFYNRKLREATGRGTVSHSRTAKVLGAVAVIGGLYFGARVLHTSIDERVEDVIEDIHENPEAGARAAYQILGAAVNSALPELSKLVAERYKAAPGEVQKLGRFAYAVVSLDDGTDQSLLGNVTLADGQISQQNGTLTVTYQQPGQFQRVYALRTLALPNGGVKLIAQEVDHVDPISGATGMVNTATPLPPIPTKLTAPTNAGPTVGPVAGAYAPSHAPTPSTPAPYAALSPATQMYKPAAPEMPTAPAGATSYAPAGPAPVQTIGSLFKTTAP